MSRIGRRLPPTAAPKPAEPPKATKPAAGSQRRQKTESRWWFDDGAELRRQLALWYHFTERDFQEARRRGLVRPPDDGER